MKRQYGEKEKEAAYLKYLECGSATKAAKDLGLSERSVCRWIKERQNAPPDGLEKVREEKKKEIVASAAEEVKAKNGDFIASTTRLINLAADVAEKILTDALEKPPDEIDISVNQLSTFIGTLYDKRALTMGESTQNTEISIKLPEDVKKYAE